jgi:acyl-CoA dehydrogenase
MSLSGNTRLALSDEQAMLLDVAREFCRARSPIAAVRAQLDTEQGFDPEVWQELVALGWTGISLPDSCGGSGLGIGAVVPVVESMGRALLTTPLINSTLAAQLLLRAGGAERSEPWLAQIAAGSAATIALLDNEDWGADCFGVTLSAAGELSGHKHFVGDAAVAELLVVTVRQDGAPALALVPQEALPPGAIAAHQLIDETRRAATVDFSGVRLAPEQIIGGEPVVPALREVRLLGALLVAAEATGSAASCLDLIVDYLKTRKQFGKLIGSYQALKHPTVDILCDVDASRSFVYHAASVVDEGPLGHDAEVACRMAKAQAGDTLAFAGDRAVQFHGGMGFTYECDAQLYIRRAQWVQQQFGDAMHQRKRLAALLLD